LMTKPVVQLATETNDPERYIKDPAWCVEQKFDGHRVLAVVSNNGVSHVQFYNRQGRPKSVPDQIVSGFRHVALMLRKTNWTVHFDGEVIGNKFYAFDIPVLIDPSKGEGNALEGMPFDKRRDLLERLHDLFGGEICRTTIILVPQATSEYDKRTIFEACQQGNREGVMFKRLDARYTADRSRDWLKYKFVKTADCVVTELNRNGKYEAMSLGLYDNEGKLQDAGGCRILPQFLGKISVDDVVEIRYLYGTSDNKPYQPVLVRLRPDKRPEECGQWQLQKTDKSPLPFRG
jgi:bifunctional non-homologous end joining protein LigD